MLSPHCSKGHVDQQSSTRGYQGVAATWIARVDFERMAASVMLNTEQILYCVKPLGQSLECR
jgi:hypothetical protein